MKVKEIRSVIHKAFEVATLKKDDGPSYRKINRSRSKNFVEELGNQFRIKYKNDSFYKVFTKHYNQNRREFGLNELLYDVLVCETKSIESSKGENLVVIKKAIWQIESEFAKDTRQALFDFNKLIIGAADNKLFIGSFVAEKNRAKYMSTLLEAAANCSGNIYLALLMHPGKWHNFERQPTILYRYNDKRWEEVV